MFGIWCLVFGILGFVPKDYGFPLGRCCVFVLNIVLQGIILRAKALANIDNSLIIHSLFLSNCLSDHVAQGFNPAKADCDTASFKGMTRKSGMPA